MVRINRKTRDEVIATLAECLGSLSGGQNPEEIAMDLLVLSVWELDSEHGIELATDLCTRLEIDIPANENPLIDETGPDKKRRERTFGEVVDYLDKMVNN